MQALAARLDGVMAEAEIAANAQRDVEAEALNPLASSARQETRDEEDQEEESAEDEGTTPADEALEEAEAEADEAEEASEEPAEPPSTDQPKYSRRDAARFAQELQAAKAELAAAKQLLDGHRGQLAAVQSSDERILTHLQTQSGYVREQNGRFRYENLSEKVLKGQATAEESEEVAQMTAWHEFAAPIFRAAEEQLSRAFIANWSTLRDLDGVGDDGLKKLNAATDVASSARAMHAMAFAAGETRAKKAADQTIAKLRAEVKSLRTGRVAHSPQPASSNGAAVPANKGILARMIDPSTGLPNPEFDREVAAGKWLGVDLSSQ
jgi:hypothetical protein